VNRRSFLRSIVGGVAAAAAVRTFPFRVYSFPTEPIRVPSLYGLAYWQDANPGYLGLNRPTVLVRTAHSISQETSDGYLLGRGCVSEYKKVLPDDDLWQLYRAGWRDPRVFGLELEQVRDARQVDLVLRDPDLNFHNLQRTKRA
jgi:hypothetical protein